MIALSTDMENVWRIQTDYHEDYRGEFAEIYNEQKYNACLPNIHFTEDDISISYLHVLKGIHGDDVTWKLISCLQGKIYLVVVNCDEKSKEFGKWISFILSDKNRSQVLVPPSHGNAHLALVDNSIIHYKQSNCYGGAVQFTYTWNNPRFKIKWPITDPILSERDC